MKKTLLSLTFIVLCQYTFAQLPTKPIQFLNFKPKWSHYMYSSQLADSAQDYNIIRYTRKPLVIDNDLYLLGNSSEYFYQGHLLEKLELSSGKLLAQHQYFDKNKNERHVACSIKEDGNSIEMLTFKENSRSLNPFIYTFWGYSNYNSFRFCNNTLTVCDSIITNPLDSNNTLLNTLVGQSYLFRRGKNIINVEARETHNENRVYYVKRVLDEKGYLIDSTTINLPVKYSKISVVLIREFKEGQYLSYVYSENATDNKQFEVKMVYFNTDFVIDKILDITSQLQPTRNLFLHYEDADNFMLSTYNNSIVNNINVRYYKYYIFNHKGDKINEISFQEPLIENKEFMNATILQPSKKILGVVRRLTNDNKTRLDFMLANNKGGADLVKSVYPDRHIRVYYPYSMPDNHVLLYIRDADSTDTKYKTTPWWTNWTMFSPESLNITASSDLPTALPNFQLSPNPAESFVRITTDLTYDAIVLYSVEGKQLMNKKTTDSILDISALPKGMYFLALQHKGQPITTLQKMIVM